MSATLKASQREKLGSRWARRLRMQGRLPACIQGEGKENRNVHIDEIAFLAARRHHEHLFDLEVDGDQETALVNELDWSPMGDRIMHVEFRRVVRGQKTEVEVELEFIGRPKGGVLQQLLNQVPLKALPTAIPDKIEVRVEELDIGDVIHAEDLVLPEEVELDIEPDAQVAVVSVVKTVVEEEEAPAEGEEVEGEAAPEGEEAEEAESKAEEES